MTNLAVREGRCLSTSSGPHNDAAAEQERQRFAGTSWQLEFHDRTGGMGAAECVRTGGSDGSARLLLHDDATLATAAMSAEPFEFLEVPPNLAHLLYVSLKLIVLFDAQSMERHQHGVLLLRLEARVLQVLLKTLDPGVELSYGAQVNLPLHFGTLQKGLSQTGQTATDVE